MPYRFQLGMMYRMPTHFGPSLGPRQREEGGKFANFDSPRTVAISVRFLTLREQLEKLIPECFILGAKPEVTVRASYMTNIEWLAGRGYNTLGISFPAIFDGNEDHVSGYFVAVLWENLTDPILTGREELGYSKIFCELPQREVHKGQTHCVASWMGFKFIDIVIWNMKKLSEEKASEYLTKQSLDGTLHYKYVPKTGEWGKPDVSYPTFTPTGNSNAVTEEILQGEGEVEFHEARWEDLPTMFNIVNTLHALEMREYRGATVVKTVGGKDLGDTRILR